jgi:hypothetical protein
LNTIRVSYYNKDGTTATLSEEGTVIVDRILGVYHQSQDNAPNNDAYQAFFYEKYGSGEGEDGLNPNGRPNNPSANKWGDVDNKTDAWRWVYNCCDDHYTFTKFKIPAGTTEDFEGVDGKIESNSVKINRWEGDSFKVQEGTAPLGSFPQPKEVPKVKN